MSAHCQQCGSRCHGTLCAFCSKEERREDEIGQDSTDENTELKPYECTLCHTEYRAADASGQCPECGGYRKRYVGELV